MTFRAERGTINGVPGVIAVIGNQHDRAIWFRCVELEQRVADQWSRLPPACTDTGWASLAGGRRLDWMVGHPDAINPTVRFRLRLVVTAKAPPTLAAARLLVSVSMAGENATDPGG